MYISEEEKGSLELLSIILWLVSQCIASSSFMNLISIDGVPVRIAEMMIKMGSEGIQSIIKNGLLSIHHVGLSFVVYLCSFTLFNVLF